MKRDSRGLHAEVVNLKNSSIIKTQFIHKSLIIVSPHSVKTPMDRSNLWFNFRQVMETLKKDNRLFL